MKHRCRCSRKLIALMGNLIIVKRIFIFNPFGSKWSKRFWHLSGIFLRQCSPSRSYLGITWLKLNVNAPWTFFFLSSVISSSPHSNCQLTNLGQEARLDISWSLEVFFFPSMVNLFMFSLCSSQELRKCLWLTSQFLCCSWQDNFWYSINYAWKFASMNEKNWRTRMKRNNWWWVGKNLIILNSKYHKKGSMNW